MKALFLVAIIANFLSLVICITELEDYFNGDMFGY